MQAPPRPRPRWSLVVTAAIVLPWLCLTALLFFSHGDVETALRGAFLRARRDAFQFLNSFLPLVWLVHTCLTLVAIAAAALRRPDVLVVLLIAPVIALMICIPLQDWSDPNWYEALAICTIGSLVSTVVAAGYWIYRPKAHPACEARAEPHASG